MLSSRQSVSFQAYLGWYSGAERCFDASGHRGDHWSDTERSHPALAKEKKEWESTWATTTTTASQTWGSPTTCFCSQPPRISFKKCCTNSRKVLKKWVSGSTHERRKFSAKNLCSESKKEMQIDDIKIEILTRSESVRYSGQLITFQQQETTEIKNRIRAAWATFHKYRQELTSENYLLKHRLRLFDAAITPTICYASGTRAPTKEHQRIIQSAQRNMFRLIIQTKRRHKKIVKHKVRPAKT